MQKGYVPLICLALLQGSAANAQTINPQKRIVGCWDNDQVGSSFQSLCFGANGRLAQTNPEREGSYRINGNKLDLDLEESSAACRFEFDPAPNRISREGRMITVSWARAGSWLQLTGCAVSGRWLKSCDKLELAYGTCPRKKPNVTATD